MIRHQKVMISYVCPLSHSTLDLSTRKLWYLFQMQWLMAFYTVIAACKLDDLSKAVFAFMPVLQLLVWAKDLGLYARLYRFTGIRGRYLAMGLL